MFLFALIYFLRSGKFSIVTFNMCCCLHLVSFRSQISKWPSVLWWSSCCFCLLQQMYHCDLFSSLWYGHCSAFLIHSFHFQLLLIVCHIKKYHDGVQTYLPCHKLVEMSVWSFPIGKNITAAILNNFPQPYKRFMFQSTVLKGIENVYKRKAWPHLKPRRHQAPTENFSSF